MWSPTHVQVLVKRAKGLNAKGKNGTNDALVTIGLGKEKYQTSVKEKAGDPVEWCEQCELAIPEQGNKAEVSLAVLHRNYLGVDEFLGQVTLPLQDYDVYEKPRTRWHPLQCKPGQSKSGYRGELEVKLGFTVKAAESSVGSVADLRKTTRGSLTSLNKVAGSLGGSLLSLGGKERRNMKELAKSMGRKVEKVGEKARQKVEAVKVGKQGGEVRGKLGRLEEDSWGGMSNRDPGVNSDEEEEEVRDDMFQFDRLSHRSSLRSELSLGKLGTVSPALTPDLGILRRSKERTEPDTESLARETREDTSSVASYQGRREDTSSVASYQGRREDTSSLASYQGRREDTSSLASYQERKEDTSSLASFNREESLPSFTREGAGSVASSSSHQTLPDDSSLPSYSQAMSRKKRIIPVVESEPESSPSPETPSSPARDVLVTTSFSSRFRNNQSLHHSDLGNKLKNSFSFKDKGSKAEPLTSQSSRTTSNSSIGPPAGARPSVLGRETSPTPTPTSRIAPEIMARFQGKTREDLIEALVGLQATAELQGKRLGELEDYLDTLLIRVMEAAPVLLQKDSMIAKPSRQ